MLHSIMSDLAPASPASPCLPTSHLTGSPFATELLCFLFLAYPCTCAYYSLYRHGSVMQSRAGLNCKGWRHSGGHCSSDLQACLVCAYCIATYHAVVISPYRLGRFAFYRMVPRHTDAYSLCYSGEGCRASQQLLPLQPSGAQQQFTVLQPVQARQGCCIPHCSWAGLQELATLLPAHPMPDAALLMCRFAAPLAFNFMAAIAMPEARGQEHAPVSGQPLKLLNLCPWAALCCCGSHCLDIANNMPPTHSCLVWHPCFKRLPGVLCRM